MRLGIRQLNGVNDVTTPSRLETEIVAKIARGRIEVNMRLNQ